MATGVLRGVDFRFLFVYGGAVTAGACERVDDTPGKSLRDGELPRAGERIVVAPDSSPARSHLRPGGISSSVIPVSMGKTGRDEKGSETISPDRPRDRETAGQRDR